LQDYRWPGNVRELQGFAELRVLGIPLQPTHSDVSLAHSRSKGLKAQVAEFEKVLIEETLIKSGGNIQGAMETLKLPRKTLYDKLRRHKLTTADFKEKST
jgi:two-component system, NtrC family, C4-dicarboxylate transport response regulator DctD